MGNCGAEIFGDRLAHVRECGADAEIHPGMCLRRVGEDRDVLAGMVGGGPARIGIAAVIRGDQQQIGGLQQREERG